MNLHYLIGISMKKYYFLFLLTQSCNDFNPNKTEDPEIEVILENDE